MTNNFSLAAGLQVQDGHFRPVADHEPRADGLHEGLVVLDECAWEAVDAKVDGGEVLDVGIVGEDADVGARPEAAEAVDELDVVGLEEDEVGSDLEGERDGAHGLSVLGQVPLLVLEDALVGGGQLGLLRDLNGERATVRSIRADSKGKRPLVVSPEVMVASVRSSTALVISATSARVGLGLLSMDSSICVAQMTYLPASMVLPMIYFCASTTFSMGSSMPRSPRATMMPSECWMISSMFWIAS